MISLAPSVAPGSDAQVLAFLQIIEDPAKYKEAFDSLLAARKAAEAEQAKLANLQSERDQLVADRAAFEKDRNAGFADLAERDAALQDRGFEQSRGEWTQLTAARKDLAVAQDQLDQAKRQHEAAVAQIANLKKLLA